MFYDKLSAICKQQNTSPSAVALALGMSKSNVTRWKSGQTPKIETVTALADYLHVDFWELLDKAPQNEKPATSDSDGLSDIDRQFIEILPKLSDQQKKMVLAQIDGLLRMKE